jgi:hypothetical protein
MHSPLAFSLLLALLPWQPVHAAPIYKWVDSAGQVTYSSTPPPAGVQTEKVEMAPPPTEAQIQEAKERARRDEEQARELEKARLEQEAARQAEEERLREMQAQQPIVIEKPVYIPQPLYYPPDVQRPRPLPPARPRPDPR